MEDNRKIIIDKQEMDNIFAQLATKILKQNSCMEKLMLIGIKTRGLPMINRLSKVIEEKCGKVPAKGELEIKLYQDDLRPIGQRPVVGKTLIQGSVDAKKIILLDDVLFTGRTIQAAINKLLELGVPESIKLCVMVDRGWHKFPICADYVGRTVETTMDEEIQVRFNETDGEDVVYLRNIV